MVLKRREFKRSRAKWSDESAARVDVANKQNVAEKHLSGDHNETHFIWTMEVDEETDFPACRIPKIEVDGLEAAEHQAMFRLGTFGGNLKHAHTDEDYIFSLHRMD